MREDFAHMSEMKLPHAFDMQFQIILFAPAWQGWFNTYQAAIAAACRGSLGWVGPYAVL